MGWAQGVQAGGEPEKAPVLTLHARTATAPQNPALHVQFHVPGVAVSCAEAVACRGGTHCEAAGDPVGQYVPGEQGLAVPDVEPWGQKLPAMQGVGAPLPAGQKDPAGHCTCVALDDAAGQ